MPTISHWNPNWRLLRKIYWFILPVTTVKMRYFNLRIHASQDIIPDWEAQPLDVQTRSRSSSELFVRQWWLASLSANKWFMLPAKGLQLWSPWEFSMTACAAPFPSPIPYILMDFMTPWKNTVHKINENIHTYTQTCWCPLKTSRNHLAQAPIFTLVSFY